MLRISSAIGVPVVRPVITETTALGAAYAAGLAVGVWGEPDDLRFALIDSDVLVTAPLAPLWALLDRTDFAGYIVDSAEDEPINGMTRRSMAQAATGLSSKEFAPLRHFGGELFATSVAAWKAEGRIFHEIVEQAALGQGPARGVLTEEHVYSIAFALLGALQDQLDRAVTNAFSLPFLLAAALLGIERELERAGYVPLFVSGNWHEDDERKAIETLLSRRVDGVIVLAGAVIWPRLGQSLLPDFKERDFLIHLRSAPGTSLPEMNRITGRLGHELHLRVLDELLERNAERVGGDLRERGRASAARGGGR